MSAFSKKELRRARRVKEDELYEKEGYKKAVLLGRTLNDYENHLYAFLIDLNICLVPVYAWGVEFILILSGVISPSYFDLLFYLMFGLLFLTSCIMLPLYTASTGGYSWGGRLMGLRLVRPDRQPASAIRLVLRQLFGFGIPMMLFGYFFSVFGIIGWWLVDGLIALVSPEQKTLADWVFGTVFVYAPRYEMRVIKNEQAADTQEPIEDETPAPEPEPVEPSRPSVLAARADFDSGRDVQQAPVQKTTRSEQHSEPVRSGPIRQIQSQADVSDGEPVQAPSKSRDSLFRRRKAKNAAGKAQISPAVDASLAAAALAAQPDPEDREPDSRIDLHIRSNFSDDSDAEVEEIFRKAKDRKMDVISITDHNNARANALAAHFASLYDIAYIPGVEIDCQLYGERVRILGYYIDWNDPFFDGIERLSLRREKDVSEARIEAFAHETGLKIEPETLLARSRFKIMRPQELTDLAFDLPEGRALPMVQKYLAQASNEAQARRQFLHDCFGPGGPCEIRAEYPGALKVIEAIHNAGGMAILSGWHLDRISNDVIEGLLDGGIDGFEVFCPNNSEKTKTFLLTLAGDEKLFVTEGSDWHGTQKKDRSLGHTTATPKGEQIVSIFTRPIMQGKKGFQSHR